MPSKGENYGHAIVECLSQGKPVIIGKNTPWQQLDKVNAGFDVSTEAISQAIQNLINADQEEYNQWSTGAAAYFVNHIERNRNKVKECYRTTLCS